MADISTIRRAPETRAQKRNLVEMNWDPITRIVGSLGIFTKIDFENRQVAECHATSSIFRGYSIFMNQCVTVTLSAGRFVWPGPSTRGVTIFRNF